MISSPAQEWLVQDSMKNMGAKSKLMIEYGQRDKVINQLAQNGWSESEIQKSLNPLSENINEEIKKLPHSVSAPEGTNKLGDNARESMTNFLKKTIKPGKTDPKNNDVVKPGVSLVLLRNKLVAEKGWNYRDVDREISNLYNDGEIQLDPYQERELHVIKSSPFRTLSLYEMIFGGQ